MTQPIWRYYCRRCGLYVTPDECDTSVSKGLRHHCPDGIRGAVDLIEEDPRQGKLF